MVVGTKRSYGDWGEILTRAERRMDDILSDYNDYLDQYRMETESEEAAASGLTVNINYHFALIRNILPSVFFRNPSVIVSPRFTSGYQAMGPQGVQMVTMKYKQAKARQKLLEYQLEKIKFDDEFRRVIMDALFSFGVMKVGYKPRMDNLSEKAPSTLDEMDVLDVDSMLAELLGEEEAGKDDSASYEPNQRITKQNPFAVRISPRHFLMDPDATHIDEARWVCHKILRPLDEVKADPRYNRSIVDGIKSTRRINDERALNEARGMHSRDYTSDANDIEAAVFIYELWDMQNQKYCVLDEWTMMHGQKKEYLVEKEWPYDGMSGFPFVLLTFNLDPDSPFGIPDVKVWDNPTRAINLVTSMRFNHVKRFNRKYETQKGNLDREQMDKLTAARDGEVVETNKAGNGPSVIPIADAPLSPDIYNFEGDMQRKVEFLSGVTEQRRGNNVSDKTATEAQFMEAQASKRDDDRLTLVTKAVQEVVTKLDQLNVSFLDRNYAAFVTDPETAMVWFQAPEEVLRMEADVKIRVGSSRYKSKEVQVDQLLKFLNLTGQIVDPMTGLPVVNVRAIITDIAEMIDLETPERFIFPMALPPAPGMAPPALGPQAGGGGSGQPPSQAQAMRNGPPTMGNMLSRVQNVGAQPTAPPNPQNG